MMAEELESSWASVRFRSEADSGLRADVCVPQWYGVDEVAPRVTGTDKNFGSPATDQYPPEFMHRRGCDLELPER